MRKCIRCGAEMKEGCAIKVEGAAYGIVFHPDQQRRVDSPAKAINRFRPAGAE